MPIVYFLHSYLNIYSYNGYVAQRSLTSLKLSDVGFLKKYIFFWLSSHNQNEQVNKICVFNVFITYVRQQSYINQFNFSFRKVKILADRIKTLKVIIILFLKREQRLNHFTTETKFHICVRNKPQLHGTLSHQITSAASVETICVLIKIGTREIRLVATLPE